MQQAEGGSARRCPGWLELKEERRRASLLRSRTSSPRPGLRRLGRDRREAPGTLPAPPGRASRSPWIPLPCRGARQPTHCWCRGAFPCSLWPLVPTKSDLRNICPHRPGSLTNRLPAGDERVTERGLRTFGSSNLWLLRAAGGQGGEERDGSAESLEGWLSQLGEQPRGRRLLWELLLLPGWPELFSQQRLSPSPAPCSSPEKHPWALRGDFPSLYPVTARRRAPARWSAGASRTPSPLCPLSPLYPAATAPSPPPPSPAPAPRDATQPLPAPAARGYAQKRGAGSDPALGRGRPGAESERAGGT